MTVVPVGQEPAALEEALDALEGMAWQYLTYEDDGTLHHAFMSAGETACDVLCHLRPERWAETPDGARYIGPEDAL